MLPVDLLFEEADDFGELGLLDLLEALGAGVIDVDHLFQDLPDDCTAPTRLYAHLTIIIRLK